MLDQHPWDNPKKAKGNGDKGKGNGKGSAAGSGNSGKQSGTDSKEGVMLQQSTDSKKSKMTCYCCGQKGHGARECTKRDTIPADKWHKPQNKDGDQSGSGQSKTGGGASGGKKEVSFTQAYQFSQTEASSMRNIVLLDSCSSANVFCNGDLVREVGPSADPISLITNAGSFAVRKEATVKNLELPVYFDEDLLSNVFSLAQLSDKYRVTMDSAEENAFFVHVGDEVVKFVRTDDNLYAHVPLLYQERDLPQKPCLVETLKENQSFLSEQQQRKAKMARELLHNLGSPTVKDFRYLLGHGLIQNCPVSPKDATIMEGLYGPDIGTAKGRTTRKKNSVGVSDVIEIPRMLIKQQRNVTLCMDVLFVNKLPFLATISKHLCYRTATFVPSKQPSAYRSVLDEVFRLYNGAGFRVTTIRCDREFKPLMDPIKDDLDIVMEYNPSKQHQPEAERNNRVLKERVRATFHRLPYQSIPKTMIQFLVALCAKQLNFFPAKGGVSQYFSPHVILHRYPVDYEKHCSLGFGTYVQASADRERTNDMRPRTLDAIVLSPRFEPRNGWYLLDLKTGRVIERMNVTKVPVTDLVIKTVEQLAKKDGMQGLNLRTKTNEVLFDSAWLAGVDFEPATEDEASGSGSDSEDEDYTTQDESDSDDSFSYDSSDDDDDSDGESDDDDEAPLVRREDPIQSESQEEDQEGDPGEEPEEPFEYPDADLAEGSEVTEGDAVEPEERVAVTETEIDLGPRKRNQPARLQMNWKGKSYGNQQQHMQIPDKNLDEYTVQDAPILAQIVVSWMYKNMKKGHHFVQSYSIKQAIKKFGKQLTKASVYKEAVQMHDRESFCPVKFEDLSPKEIQRVMNMFVFLTQKSSGEVKTRAVADGRSQRPYTTKEEASSPTVKTESTMMTAAIAAKEGRCIASSDVPNAFVQAAWKLRDKDGLRTILRVDGEFALALVERAPEIYQAYLRYEKGKPVLYLIVMRAIYGMLKSALEYYKKFRADMEGAGFVVNPYDPCVANKMVDGYQITVSWHVDDLLISHKDPKVVERYINWLDKTYGNIGQLKVVRGKVHDYLGCRLDFSVDGEVKIDMTAYVQSMVEEFEPYAKQGKKAVTPASDHLFMISTNSKKLEQLKAEVFHTFVAKALFVGKRARPDILTAIAFLCTRVKEPQEDDWNKLCRMMAYLKGTPDESLILRADDTNKICWYVDASFAVHADMRSHTGACMTMGKGAAQTISTKQKVNTRSSTKAELIAVDDVIAQIMWTTHFLKAQGYDVESTVLLQDNQSTMKLINNGMWSSGKRTRHLNIRYFFVTDQIQSGVLDVEYCPTEEMVADYLTKPTQGNTYRKLKGSLMNRPVTHETKDSTKSVQKKVTFALSE